MLQNIKILCIIFYPSSTEDFHTVYGLLSDLLNLFNTMLECATLAPIDIQHSEGRAL